MKPIHILSLLLTAVVLSSCTATAAGSITPQATPTPTPVPTATPGATVIING